MHADNNLRHLFGRLSRNQASSFGTQLQSVFSTSEPRANRRVLQEFRGQDRRPNFQPSICFQRCSNRRTHLCHTCPASSSVSWHHQIDSNEPGEHDSPTYAKMLPRFGSILAIQPWWRGKFVPGLGMVWSFIRPPRYSAYNLLKGKPQPRPAKGDLRGCEGDLK